MEGPELWRWIWLVTAAGFTLGEIAFAGSFFLLPFAIGAAVAALAAFIGLSLGIEWAAFVIVSAGACAVLWPISRRLDRGDPINGIGARRLIGEEGVVLNEIGTGPTSSGLVRIGREEWRADSVDHVGLAEGTSIKVVEVKGTRVIVHPTSTNQVEDRDKGDG